MSWGYGSGGPPPQGSYGGYGQQPPPGGNYRPPPASGYGYQQPPTSSYNTGYHPPPGGSGYRHPPPTQGYQQQPPPTQGPPPGYGAPPPSMGLDPTIIEWFRAVDADNSGQISAIELRQALVNSNWSHFNPETCRLLIGMFDKDNNGTIDIYEFGALWKYVQEWKGCFDRFDVDKSGNISASELQAALQAFGYRLSIDFCKVCTTVFDRSDRNSMKFDDFIQCCVMLRGLTESFQAVDTDRDGMIDVSYEQFLEMALGSMK